MFKTTAEIIEAGGTYMPLKLKGVLPRHGLSQRAWAHHVIQSAGHAGGRPMSKPIAALLINWGQWPVCTPQAEIKGQTEDWLRRCGVPEEDIAAIWEIDMVDEYRFAQPRRKVRAGNEQPRGNGAQSGAVYEIENPLSEREMLSQSAKRHFALLRDPFQDDVQGHEDVFLTPEQRYIRENMFNTAQQGGFLAVIGESGAGKSVLRRDLLDRIRREDHAIVPIMPRTIDKQRLTAGAICDAITGDLSSENPRRSLEAKARQIERLLISSGRDGASHVLIIEEAHDLSIQTLKFLKRFWELEDGFRRLLAIILIGQPELGDKFTGNNAIQAREVIRRMDVAELDPLGDGLEEYLAFKLKRLNRKPEEVFEADPMRPFVKSLSCRLGNGPGNRAPRSTPCWSTPW